MPTARRREKHRLLVIARDARPRRIVETLERRADVPAAADLGEADVAVQTARGQECVLGRAFPSGDDLPHRAEIDPVAAQPAAELLVRIPHDRRYLDGLTRHAFRPGPARRRLAAEDIADRAEPERRAGDQEHRGGADDGQRYDERATELPTTAARAGDDVCPIPPRRVKRRRQPVEVGADQGFDVDHCRTSWISLRSFRCAAPSVAETVPTSTSSTSAIAR